MIIRIIGSAKELHLGLSKFEYFQYCYDQEDGDDLEDILEEIQAHAAIRESILRGFINALEGYARDVMNGYSQYVKYQQLKENIHLFRMPIINHKMMHVTFKRTEGRLVACGFQFIADIHRLTAQLLAGFVLNRNSTSVRFFINEEQINPTLVMAAHLHKMANDEAGYAMTLDLAKQEINI